LKARRRLSGGQNNSDSDEAREREFGEIALIGKT
jgi:hypothetical protein